MLGTRAARLHHAFAQRLARPEQAHPSVTRRHTLFNRERLHGCPVHVYGFEDFGVLWLERAGKTPDAGADFTVQVLGWVLRSLDFLCERLECFLGSHATPLVVDHSVSELSLIHISEPTR